MNQLITRKLLGTDPTQDVAPIVLDRYANTASAGSIIAFAQNHEDLKSGDRGVICSFGAGYSIGSLVVQSCSLTGNGRAGRRVGRLQHKGAERSR
jgi:beta-ketodecanoyl-[acyl-carrier-protein] synthase